MLVVNYKLYVFIPELVCVDSGFATVMINNSTLEESLK
jgi:hypothetical protein